MRLPALGPMLLLCSAACSTRGGYAEPGPLSASAYPPAPPSVQSGQPLQPSPGDGRPSAIPPAVGPGGNNIPASADGNPESQCASDADCLPDACCHPAACVVRASAPRCTGTHCTTECRPGTLDCGEAHCMCLGGRCGVQRRG